IFKVEPVMRAVEELDLKAWFSGMRKTESEKRSMYTYVWPQGPFVKLHPILD
ncbi:phosphoadenosine phosphosulfate reductase family protein, partial [Candidatus Bathyarchaeota archaeon]|nr:phosphoadenosine phosphosulfate reductase family protein [Candidatus Bathyarchaeota archaeon]